MDRMITSSGRRRFLAQVGGVAVAAAGSPFARGLTSVEAAELGPTKPNQRVADAYRLRHDAAVFHKNLPMPAQVTNGDDERYANAGYIGSFTKTLPHNGFGVVDPPDAYRALLTAMASGGAVVVAAHDLVPGWATVVRAGDRFGVERLG